MVKALNTARASDLNVSSHRNDASDRERRCSCSDSTSDFGLLVSLRSSPRRRCQHFKILDLNVYSDQ